MKHHDFRKTMPGNFSLDLWGDTHYGLSARIKHVVRYFISQQKASKNRYCALGGDLVDGITCTDKRYNIEAHAYDMPRITDQIDGFCHDFEPIAAHILYVLAGNHELKEHENKYDIAGTIAKTLGTQYGRGVFAKTHFPGFNLADWHGDGSLHTNKAGDALQRKTNEQIRLKRKLRELPADDCEIMACHHFHRVIIHPPSERLLLVSDPERKRLKQYYASPHRIWINKKRHIYTIPEEFRWYVCCGSALRGYMENEITYVEKYGLSPTEIGWIRVTVQNDKIYKVEPIYYNI